MVILAFSPSCSDKEDPDDGWEFCTGCTAESWAGVFEGDATFHDSFGISSGEGLAATLSIEETGTDYLSTTIVVPNYFSTAVSGKLNSAYSISFAGSNSSITATIYSKNNALKIIGNAKKFHTNASGTIVDEVVSFEVIKNK